MMRDCAFQAALRFSTTTINPSAPALTHREMECLTWCSTGKSSWEIGQILKCTEATVNFHILNLRRKLHATSRRQAVVNAIHCGLLRRTPKKHLSQLLFGIKEDAIERITSKWFDFLQASEIIWVADNVPPLVITPPSYAKLLPIRTRNRQ